MLSGEQFPYDLHVSIYIYCNDRKKIILNLGFIKLRPKKRLRYVRQYKYEVVSPAEKLLSEEPYVKCYCTARNLFTFLNGYNQSLKFWRLPSYSGINDGKDIDTHQVTMISQPTVVRIIRR